MKAFLHFVFTPIQYKYLRFVIALFKCIKQYLNVSPLRRAWIVFLSVFVSLHSDETGLSEALVTHRAGISVRRANPSVLQHLEQRSHVDACPRALYMRTIPNPAWDLRNRTVTWPGHRHTNLFWLDATCSRGFKSKDTSDSDTMFVFQSRNYKCTLCILNMISQFYRLNRLWEYMC